MKKTFPLTAPGKADARVLDSVKNEVRKYVQRERRKPLPEDFQIWTFACRVGPTAEAATPCEIPGLSAAVDAVANTGVSHVYVEIIASPGYRASASSPGNPVSGPAPRP